jgi:hypothetical protein
MLDHARVDSSLLRSHSMPCERSLPAHAGADQHRGYVA